VSTPGRTEFVTTLKRRRTFVDARGKPLEQADGDVAVLEGECFAEVAPRLVHPDRVRSEMGQPIFCVLSPSQNARRGMERGQGEGAKRRRHATYLANELEAFPRANVPLPSLLDFGEYPWLDERASSDHDAVYAGGVDLFPVILGGETVAAAKDGDRVHWGHQSCGSRWC
jgi:hypothetical protein